MINLFRKTTSLIIAATVAFSAAPAAASYGEAELSATQALYLRQNFDVEKTAAKGYSVIEKTDPVTGAVNSVRVGSDAKYGHGGYLRLDAVFSSNDCMADVSTMGLAEKIVISMDFLLENNNITNQLVFLRDAYSAQRNVDVIPAQVNAKGYFVAGGKQTRNVNDGKWHNTAVMLDVKNHIMDVYLDGAAVARNAALRSEFEELTLFRVRLSPDNKGTGTLLVDNWLIYEGSVPRKIGDDEIAAGAGSLFRTDSYAVRKLSGIGAVNAYSGTYFDGSSKRKSDGIHHDGDVTYVSADIFAAVTGLAVSQSGNTATAGGVKFIADSRAAAKGGGTVYMNAAPRVTDGMFCLPLAEAAGVIDGLYTHDDMHGTVFVDDNPIDMPAAVMKETSNYMFFDRKSQSDILSMISNISAHPRIIATADDFARVNSLVVTNARMKNWHTKLIAKANTELTKPVVEYKLTNNKLLSVSHQTRERMLIFGYAYRMTGDRKYLDGAMANIEAAAAFPDWNEVHFLDPSEMSAAFAIAYDWFYDGLSAQQKNTIKTALKEKALDFAYDTYNGNGTSSWWATNSLNWNGVCNGGIGLGALAIADEEPEYCGKIIYSALRLMENAWYMIAPDGAWEESGGYWSYYTDYFSKFMASAEKSFCTDLGFWKYRGADTFGCYPTIMSSETESYNFHDGGSNMISSSALYYIADVLGDTTLTALRNHDIDSHGLGPDVCDMVWYKPETEGGEFVRATDNYIRDVELVSFREKWFDKESMFAAYHGGVVKGAHMHYDTGSFVYDVNGVRWACDLGSDDYYYYTLYGDDNVYRRRAEGHNIFVINPSEAPGQEGDFGQVTRFETNGGEALTTVDLSECYQSYATKVTRGMMTADGKRSLIVRDEINLSGTYPIYWFMHTAAKAEKIAENKFRLSKNGKSVIVLIDTNLENYSTSIMAAKPLPTSPQAPEQNPNSGYSKIAIYAPNASKNIQVTMKLLPEGEGFNENTVSVGNLDDWSIGMLSEKFGNFSANDESRITSGAFGKAPDDKALYTAYTRLDTMRNSIENADIVRFSADICPSGGSAAIHLNGTSGSEIIVKPLGDMVSFGADGSLTVFNKKVFDAGAPFDSQKWYRIDVEYTAAVDGGTFSAYVDGIAAVTDCRTDFSITAVDFAELKADSGAYFDNVVFEKSEKSLSDFRQLKIACTDSNYAKRLMTARGIEAYETDETVYNAAALRKIGISGGTLDKTFRYGADGEKYMIINSSNGFEIIVPIRRLGMTVDSGRSISNCNAAAVGSGALPVTVEMTVSASSAFRLLYGGSVIFDAAECDKYVSGQNRLAVTFYPRTKNAQVYLNGTKVGEEGYTPSFGGFLLGGAMCRNYILYTGAYENREYFSQPSFEADGDMVTVSFVGGSLVGRRVYFAATADGGTAFVKRLDIGDKQKYSQTVGGDEINVFVMDAQTLLPLTIHQIYIP